MSYQRSEAEGDNFVRLSPSRYNKIAKLDSNQEFAQLLNSDDDKSPNIVLDNLSDSSNSGSYKSNNSSSVNVQSYREDCNIVSDDRAADCSIDSSEGDRSDPDSGEAVEVISKTKYSSNEDSDDLGFITEAQDDISDTRIESEDSGDDSQSNNDADNETSSKRDSSDSDKSSISDSEGETCVKLDEHEQLLSGRSEKSHAKSEKGSNLQSNASSPSRSAEYSSDGHSSKFNSDEETTSQHDPHDNLTSKPDFKPADDERNMLVPSRSGYKVVHYYTESGGERSSNVGSCDGRSSRHESDEGVSSKLATSSSDEISLYDSDIDQRLIIEDVDENESSGSDVEALNAVDKLEEEENEEVVKAIRQSEGEDNDDVGSVHAVSSFCYSSDSDEALFLDGESLELVESDESSEDELIRSGNGSETERIRSRNGSVNEEGISAKGSDDESRSDCSSEEDLIQREKEDEAESASYGDGNGSDQKHGSRKYVFQPSAEKYQKHIEAKHSSKSATGLAETEFRETTHLTEINKTESLLDLLPVDIGSASDSDDRETINKFFQMSGDEDDTKDSDCDEGVEARYKETMDKLDRVMGRPMRRTKEFTGNKYRSPEHTRPS